jgi:hypothetical protein
MSVCNYADSSISIYSLRVQVSALEKRLALFCLVIRFCMKVMEVTAESWSSERQETLSGGGEVSEIPLPLREDRPEPERISGKLRTVSRLVARAQDGNAHLPGEEEKSPINFPQVVHPPFSLPTFQPKPELRSQI